MVKIMVVEDDQKLNNLFSRTLQHHGYQTESVFDGEEALEMLDNEYIDLIISDIMMPRLNGIDFIKQIRDAKYDIPVLFITAKGDYKDIEDAFSVGVDDYMIKPINVNEMILRVKALLKRAQISTERKIICGRTTVDYDALTVSFGNEEILLPQKEFLLLYKLLSYPNRIFTRQQLMDEIWGMDSETDERTVDVHINRLRERLKENDDFTIITVRGLGYKMVKTYDKE